ncbi:alpha-xenorhabdolysin family binary toxin subunit A [Vibrio tetraodonis]|uniref:alpha-xenorhabdolysin family binary toxin subunit A n=1 Tax=Vibrio tetraodonis TaxID=2231647 RepID=UPI000E0AED89|nr:alpha-xenorhabdolysin family binary toxin subunit A [Vibrio tetraodonis]
MDWCKAVLAASCMLAVHNVSLAENYNGLGNLDVFTSESDDVLLNEEEWIKLNMLARSASTLPVTQESMRKRFYMSNYVAFDGVYQDLLSNYQNINHISSDWLGDTGYRNRMITLVENLIEYSHEVNDSSIGMLQQTQLIVEAAENADYLAFERVKADLLAILEAMLEDATRYYQDADSLGHGLTDFINSLDAQVQDLHRLQSSNKDILDNDGSEASREIDALKQRIDELNSEYRKWVTVAATTPTYAWIFPFGTIAAISTAGAGSAKAVALKNEIQSIREDVIALREEMAHDQAVYLSWNIATDSIENILESTRSALAAQQRLRGGWALISSQLESVIKGINDINSDDVLHDPDNFIAAYLTELEVEKLQSRWENLGNEGEIWLANSDVTGISSTQFSVPIRSDLADELGISYSTEITEYTTGLSWPTYDFQQATDLCKNQGMRLPTKFELEELQAWFKQYEDIDPNVWPVASHYWSATIDPQGRYYTVGVDGGGSKLYPHGHQYVACTGGEVLNAPVPPPPEVSNEFSLPLTKEEADREGYTYTGYKSEIDFGPKWVTFTYEQAKNMCQSRGMRLPNAEELSAFSQQGAVGWPTHRVYWTDNNPIDYNWDYTMYISNSNPIVSMKSWTGYVSCK